MRVQYSFEVKVLISFCAAALAMLGMLATTWKLARDSAEASHSVRRTFEMLHHLAEIKAQTLQIELSTQGYRISGDRSHLAERDTSTAAREDVMARVRDLTADSPAQRARWHQLREVLDARIALSRRIEALRATEGLEAATAFATGAPLRETRQQTYRIMSDIEGAERQLLDARSDAQHRAWRHAVTAGLVVTASLLALLGASYFFIRRQVRRTEADRKALADSEGSLSTTLQSIGEGVLATDAAGRVVRMNPVAEQLTGWRAADAVGASVEQLVTLVEEDTRRPALVPTLHGLVAGQSTRRADRLLLVSRSGEELPIAYNAAPIRGPTGAVQGVVLVFYDVSLQRQAERAIREQNSLLEQRVQERTAQLWESEAHLRRVIGSVPALIAYVDAQERYVYANEPYRGRFAPSHRSLAGKTVREILGESRYAMAAPMIQGALAGHPQAYDWEPFPGVWQSISYVPRRDAVGRPCGYYVLGTDITARKLAEAQIQNLNAALAQRVAELQRIDRALRTLSAGNRSMLRATDEKGLLDSMCDAIARAGGYPIAMVWYAHQDERKSMEVVAQCGYAPGLSVLQQLKPSWEDNAYGQGAIAKAIRTGHVTVVGDMHVDPSYAPWRPYLMGNTSCFACPLVIEGATVGALALFSPQPDDFGPDEIPLLCESADDLAFGIATLRASAERKRAHEAVHRLTHYDALTGLPNETQFVEAVTRAMGHALERGGAFTVLQTNIERLSEINDALGFAHGDQVLKEFAARLRAAAPETATVARLRGDEFAILVPEGPAADGAAMAQRLAAAVAPPFPVADIRLDVTARTGIVVFPEHATNQHELFRRLGIAVRDAKQRGEPHAIFDARQDQKKPQRLSLAGELRRAIEGGDLLVFLQPKVEIASGRVTGAEALVRWHHTDRGMVQPGEFIGLAEHTGLIKPLTEWMIERVVQLGLAWKGSASAVPIAVNLSARNLHDADLIRKIKAWAPVAGLLELELTESTVMENADRALAILRALRAEGIALYVDDFGTGYSSLSYLQKLPVEHIKIDQSFVRNMSTDRDSAVIVRSTIDLIHDLGRSAVAEGIETQEDWDRLAGFGCDVAQGFFIARPMPADDFPAWLARRAAAA